MLVKNYFLRISISLDGFVQSFFRFGTIGITISSRAATGAAHGHPWGCWLCKLLDAVDRGHCKSAIRNDLLRAHTVIRELNDPAVLRWKRRK